MEQTNSQNISETAAGTTDNQVTRRQILEEAITADVVEVVRCEHCKHSWFNGVSLWLCQREANSYCPTVKADAFCSYGERKEQNNV